MNKDKTIFCSCGTHMIQVGPGLHDEMVILFYELKTDKNISFWYKIKIAFNYLFKNEGHLEYDIVLNPDEQEILSKIIQNLIEERKSVN